MVSWGVGPELAPSPHAAVSARRSAPMSSRAVRASIRHLLCAELTPACSCLQLSLVTCAICGDPPTHVPECKGGSRAALSLISCPQGDTKRLEISVSRRIIDTMIASGSVAVFEPSLTKTPDSINEMGVSINENRRTQTRKTLVFAISIKQSRSDRVQWLPW